MGGAVLLQHQYVMRRENFVGTLSITRRGEPWEPVISLLGGRSVDSVVLAGQCAFFSVNVSRNGWVRTIGIFRVDLRSREIAKVVPPRALGPKQLRVCGTLDNNTVVVHSELMGTFDEAWRVNVVNGTWGAFDM